MILQFWRETAIRCIKEPYIFFEISLDFRVTVASVRPACIFKVLKISRNIKKFCDKT